MSSCKVCDKNCYGEFCFSHKPQKQMKRTKLNPKGKKTKKWLKFRKEYLKDKRDWKGDLTCEHCGKESKYMEVDHKIKRSIAPDKVFDKANLQVLCGKCHRKKDS